MSVRIIINVLDDDEMILEFIKNIFSDDPIYNVSTFYNQEDFKKAFNENVDLIITDVKVPRYDFINSLKEFVEINPGCYIIVISGFVDNKEFLLPLFPLGVQYVIEKTSNIEWYNEIRKAVDALKPKMLKRAKFFA